MRAGLRCSLSKHAMPSTCRGARPMSATRSGCSGSIRFGLLRASFWPKGQIAELRAYVRQRERLLEYSASHIQHMQKALTEMNLQLHHVVADITGVAGLVRAILADVRDPETLAGFRHYSCHSSPETIAKALTGSSRAAHFFALEQALALYDAYQEKASACDDWIEAVSSLGLAPRSGGKMISSRTRRFGGRATALLRLAAVTVGRTDTALGAFYRRLSSRTGAVADGGAQDCRSSHSAAHRAVDASRRSRERRVARDGQRHSARGRH